MKRGSDRSLRVALKSILFGAGQLHCECNLFDSCFCNLLFIFFEPFLPIFLR